ncbi:MAG: rhomboid family intramembrane serine protease [Taibaiella sp.]|nr:rhomboid family intramembrane serine protease [Taibaiella sp.]
MCFNNERLYNKFILYPYEMHRAPSEYYRVLTSGLIHANWTHLLFNMLTLYFFGPYVESILGGGQFVLFYVLALVAADLSTLIKYKNQPAYRSLGASGAVAAVIFAYIYVNPWSSLYIFFAIPIPAIVFAILYILYSIRMSRMQADNINHDAHLYGALFGLLYMLVFVDPSHGLLFIERLKEFSLFR